MFDEVEMISERPLSSEMKDRVKRRLLAVSSVTAAGPSFPHSAVSVQAPRPHLRTRRCNLGIWAAATRLAAARQEAPIESLAAWRPAPCPPHDAH